MRVSGLNLLFHVKSVEALAFISKYQESLKK
jgi:hypothetical protein